MEDKVDSIVDRWPERIKYWVWDLTEMVTDKLHASICGAVGHEPISDQCNIPEHDYCVWCGTGTPNEALR